MNQLPSEILTEICSLLSDDLETIRSLRLVSKQVSSASSYFLPIKTATVRLTSKSLSLFEYLCYHHAFSKSICTVNIDVSYFERLLAESQQVFMWYCEEILYRRGSSCSKASLTVSQDVNGKPATPYHQLVMQLHGMYVEWYNDQQSIRKDDQHIVRICNALTNLPSLERLALADAPNTKSDLRPHGFQDLLESKIPNSYFKDLKFAMQTSRWSGFLCTADRTAPPTEMVRELFSQLGKCNVRPRSISFDVGALADLKCLDLSPEQERDLTTFVSETTRLRISINGVRNAGLRSYEETIALSIFTETLFSAPMLESLELHLYDAQRLCSSSIGLGDLLPLDQKWPNLKFCKLSCLPSTIADMRKLLANHGNGDRLRDFEWSSASLIGARWDELATEMPSLGVPVAGSKITGCYADETRDVVLKSSLNGMVHSYRDLYDISWRYY